MFRAPVRPLVIALLIAAASSVSFHARGLAESAGSLPPVVANDNRRPAGKLDGSTLKVSLRAGRGSLQPEGPDGPRLSIEALGEETSPLTVPAPLIRAEAGTLIDVKLRNDLDALLQPELDHVVVVGRSGIDPAAPDVLVPATPLVINGEAAPVFTWQAGVRHRVRLINITPDSIVSLSLHNSQGPLTWLPAAKDGAPLPDSLRQSTPARQTIAVGETYDFEIELPPGRRTLWLEVRSPAGKWEAQGQVIVK